MTWLSRNKTEPRPILDHGYLERLTAHLGPMVVAELLADGLIELSDRLARLRELAAEGDRAGIARHGHDIVSTAGHLGLSALSIAAVEMNRAARGDGGPPPSAEELVAPLLHLAGPSLEALGRIVQEMSRR